MLSRKPRRKRGKQVCASLLWQDRVPLAAPPPFSVVVHEKLVLSIWPHSLIHALNGDLVQMSVNHVGSPAIEGCMAEIVVSGKLEFSEHFIFEAFACTRYLQALLSNVLMCPKALANLRDQKNKSGQFTVVRAYKAQFIDYY